MPPNTTPPPEPDVTPPATTPTDSSKSTGPGMPGWLPKLVLVLMAVLVVLSVVYAFGRPKSKTATNPAKTSQSASQLQTAEVTINSGGFDPATVEVRAGTQVTWTNKDTSSHQVAADPYPKDNSIPGFDSTVILQPKDTVSFVFDKPGTYTYHDERHPLNLKGTVVVK